MKFITDETYSVLNDFHRNMHEIYENAPNDSQFKMATLGGLLYMYLHNNIFNKKNDREQEFNMVQNQKQLIEKFRGDFTGRDLLGTLADSLKTMDCIVCECGGVLQFTAGCDFSQEDINVAPEQINVYYVCNKCNKIMSLNEAKLWLAELEAKREKLYGT